MLLFRVCKNVLFSLVLSVFKTIFNPQKKLKKKTTQTSGRAQRPPQDPRSRFYRPTFSRAAGLTFITTGLCGRGRGKLFMYLCIYSFWGFLWLIYSVFCYSALHLPAVSCTQHALSVKLHEAALKSE